MLISAFRPTGADISPKAAVRRQTETVDAFVASAGDGRLSELDALAALALSAKAKVTAELPSDLAAAVRVELGDSGVVSLSDERVKTLNGYMRDGWESPFFDPLATLGQGWEEQKREHPSSGPAVFSRFGDTVIQHISFDQQQGTTTLTTIHSESFISTRHYGIVEDRLGKVTVSDQRAH